MKQNNLNSIFTSSKVYLISLLLGQIFLPVISRAQTVPSLFVSIDYMKVKPENHWKYLEVEQEIWKPMHEERISQGIIVGWYLYALEFSGTENEYNYVAISLYDKAENLENPWNAEIPQKIHPNQTLNEILEKTHNSRENVKTELFYSIASAPEIPLEIPSSYMQVNFMNVDPGMEAEYEKLESEIWLPIHQESIKSGRTAGWGVWRSLYPRGSSQKYQYIAFNSFSQFSYVFDLDFSIPFNEIHPGRDFEEVAQKAIETRTIYRVELWDLIDYVIR